MKHFSFFVLVSVIAQFVYAQKLDTSLVNAKSPQALHDFYMEKSVANKTAGWILRGGGLIMTISGVLINLNEHMSKRNGDKSKGAGLAYSGIAVTLGSIPFFMAAKKNKLNARIALAGESVTVGNNLLFKPSYPAFVVTIPL